MAERSIAAVLKTVDLRGSGGSNPSLSAKNKRPREGESLLSDSRGRLFLQGPSWRRTRDGCSQSLSLRKKQTASGRRKLAFGFPRSSVFARAFLAKAQGWTQSIPLRPKTTVGKTGFHQAVESFFFVQKKIYRARHRLHFLLFFSPSLRHCHLPTVRWGNPHVL